MTRTRAANTWLHLLALEAPSNSERPRVVHELDGVLASEATDGLQLQLRAATKVY